MEQETITYKIHSGGEFMSLFLIHVVWNCYAMKFRWLHMHKGHGSNQFTLLKLMVVVDFYNDCGYVMWEYRDVPHDMNILPIHTTF